MDMPRRPYRHGNLPNAMRAAARAILDEAGPDAVGLRETARRVGVSATAAYRHFTSKEDLLASVAAEGFRELAASMELAASEPDPLIAVGLAYVEFALQKRGLFRLMFGPILVERAKYPLLNEAAGAAFDILQRVAGPDERPREENAATMAAWAGSMAVGPPDRWSRPRSARARPRRRDSPSGPGRPSRSIGPSPEAEPAANSAGVGKVAQGGGPSPSETTSLRLRHR